jgi:hypothetical protein
MLLLTQFVRKKNHKSAIGKYTETYLRYTIAHSPGSIPGTTKKKAVGLERGPLSLVSTTEELLDRKVAAPV